MGFKTLEEMKAYQAARAFKLAVYAILDSSPRAQRDFAFMDQIRDAASGVESNVAEGFGRYLAGDFIRYLRVSRSCAYETLGWLRDGVDRRHFAADRTKRARELGDESLRLINGLIRSLLPFAERRRRRPRGRKEPARRPRNRGDK